MGTVCCLCWGIFTEIFVPVEDEEAPATPVARSPSRDKLRKESEDGWNRSSYQDGGFEHERYDAGSSGARQPTEWAEAGKDAQAYLKKQTEQAYDFAKKISIEDAKKGATETAKKAKKWGGSLLSSISATISSASASVTKVRSLHRVCRWSIRADRWPAVVCCWTQSENIQVGGVNVQVVRLLAEGAYAQVLLVRSATNETFALKRILCQSQEVEDDVKMELQVFRVRLNSWCEMRRTYMTNDRIRLAVVLNVQSVNHLNIMPLVEFADARVQQGMEVGASGLVGLMRWFLTVMLLL
jgi:hypothetical protein